MHNTKTAAHTRFVLLSLLCLAHATAFAQGVGAQTTDAQKIAQGLPPATNNTNFEKAMTLKALGDQRNQEYQKWRRDLSREQFPLSAGYDVALEAVENHAQIRSYYFSFDIPGRGKLVEDVKRLAKGIERAEVKKMRTEQARIESLSAYEASLKIITPLADSDALNDPWQHALAMAYLDLARATYNEYSKAKSLAYSDAALAIQLRLANSQPANTTWKLALANVYQALGFAQKGLGWEDPFPGTTKRAEYAIRSALQDADPKNPQWRHDMVAIDLRFADMFLRVGHTTNLNGALLNAFDQIKEINFDDYSPQWQHEFALDFARIAVVAQEVGGGTTKSGLRAQAAMVLAIPQLRKQAEGNPGNKQWQRDYAYYLIESAKIENRLSDAAKKTARDQYASAIKIYKEVLQRDVGDARSQVDLVEAYKQFNDVFQLGLSRSAVLEIVEHLEEGLRYLQMQSAKAPANTAWLYYQLELYHQLIFWQGDSLRARLGGYPDGAGPEGDAIRKRAQKMAEATFEKMLAIIRTLVDMHGRRSDIAPKSP